LHIPTHSQKLAGTRSKEIDPKNLTRHRATY
jgi:hypothetical protein